MKNGSRHRKGHAQSDSRHAPSTAGAMAHAAVDSMDQVAGRVSESVRQKLESGQARSSRFREDFTKAVQENPLCALAIALGVGMIAGLLWRRD